MRLRTALFAVLVVSSCRSSADEPPGPAPSASAPASAASEASVELVEAGPDTASVLEPDLTKVLSSFDTTYSLAGHQGDRAVNVRLAASRSSFVLRPGESWSFNKAVGPRTKENGFVMAPVISDGEFVEDWGGGTCQVSSTLHAAAVMGGLDVLRRTSHSRPSSYLRPGLDATVLFPPECDGEPKKGCYAADLVVRNPYLAPLSVVVSVRPKDKTHETVHVDILGVSPDFKVSYAWAPKKAEPFVQRTKASAKVKAPRLKQKGSPGAGGTSTVTYEFLDGTRKVRRYESTYKPVDELWEVPEGWDESGPPPWELQDAGPPDSGPADASARD